MLNGKTTQTNPYGPIFSPIAVLVLEIMIICGHVWCLLLWKPGVLKIYGDFISNMLC